MGIITGVMTAIFFSMIFTSLSFGRGWKAGMKYAADAGPPLEACGIIQAISDANPDKQPGNLIRRIVKIMEELGEASEAFLNVTSLSNGKNKRWSDVREELADAVIVAVDCALTPTPDQIEAGLTREQVMAAFANVIGRKLTKWRKNRDTGKAATDAE